MARMEINKRIDSLLRKRTRLALELQLACDELDEFLQKHGIEPDPACWLGGVEIYVNPEEAETEVRKTIEAC